MSSRAYVQAAVDAGYEVIALDVFADADVKAIANQIFKLSMRENLLDEVDFKRIFLQLNLTNIHGFVYGSLFDNCPDLLDWVAERVPLIGNTSDVLKQAKAFSFFKQLDDLGIAHPEVRLRSPSIPNPSAPNWLFKKIGGTGGMHIKPAIQAADGESFQQGYFQKMQAGTPISMLFVADGKAAKTIGFNQQLIAPTTELPYRFAGAVSGIALLSNIHEAFEQAAQKLANAFNLRGINSLDAILDNNQLWILELNPRLSATFQLYPNLFALHIQGCAGNLDDFLPFTNPSHAQYILYADKTLEIAADFVWPDWAADIPTVEDEVFNIRTSIKSGAKISENMPICSVLAQADTAEIAHSLLLQRAKNLTEALYND